MSNPQKVPRRGGAGLTKKRKPQKSFKLLLGDYRHPSLKSRKMSGRDVFEARIDHHYSFRFVIDDDDILIISAGIHDVGLGKK